MNKFPEGFLWGTCTSAYQIEGAVHEDGRGESIWDRFAHGAGNIHANENADVACDHYHRFADDVQMMREMGYNAYRFSISWPRILPEGRGALNGRGLDFYNRLTDALLEQGITPNATLYHWDLPQALGGWGSRGTVQAFADYVDVVTRRLGDRIKIWATLNEPWCSSILGYQRGEHAPGEKDPVLALQVAHHLLLAHGQALPIIRANCPGAQAGVVLNLIPTDPISDSEADQAAVRYYDGHFNRWFLDPLFKGAYPDDMLKLYTRMGWLVAGRPDYVRPGDMHTIATPLDFLGINYYSRAVVGAVAGHEHEPGRIRFAQPARETATDMDWEVYPEGLYRLLVDTYRNYHPARLHISENGAAYTDVPAADGAIHDRRRIDYLASHLDAAYRAIQAGVPLGGYFVWSLMDNFEWSNGYSKRFGLFDVDYTTQARTPRDSAKWYGQVARQNGLD